MPYKNHKVRGGGVHPYNGKNNGRGSRASSKIYKGIRYSKRKLKRAFEMIDREKKII